MSKRIKAGLVFMLFTAVSATAGGTYCELRGTLAGNSYDLKLDDRATQPASLEFSTINDDGSFQASLHRRGASAVEVGGRFTWVPEAAMPGTTLRVPPHYRMDLDVQTLRYAYWVVPSPTIQLICIDCARKRC